MVPPYYTITLRAEPLNSLFSLKHPALCLTVENLINVYFLAHGCTIGNN